MRKRNLILPLFVCSLFVPSLESIQSATLFKAFEKENFFHDEVDILLAEEHNEKRTLHGGSSGDDGGSSNEDIGSNGGSGPKSKQQKENTKKNKQKAKDAAKKRIAISKAIAGKPLNDEEKEIVYGDINQITNRFNEVVNVLKNLKLSLKNGDEALTQKLLQELYRDYLALTYGDGEYTPDNILRMIEMGDEGIDALIKTYESAFTLLVAKSKAAVSDVLTDEENYIFFDNASKNPDAGLPKETYDYFKNNNINTKDTAINELKKLKKAIKDKDEDLILKIKLNFLARITSLSEDETFDDNFIEILNNTGEEGIDLLIKTFELGGFEKYK